MAASQCQLGRAPWIAPDRSTCAAVRQPAPARNLWLHSVAVSIHSHADPVQNGCTFQRFSIHLGGRCCGPWLAASMTACNSKCCRAIHIRSTYESQRLGCHQIDSTSPIYRIRVRTPPASNRA